MGPSLTHNHFTHTHLGLGTLPLHTEFEGLQKSETTNWVVATAGEFDSSAITGNGLEALKGALEDDKIQFGTFKALGVDKQASVTSTRVKYCNFQWIGPNVPPMKKMKALQGKEEVAVILTGPAITVELTERSEISAKYFGKELLRVGGAHKPTHYDFGEDVTIAVSAL